MRKLIPLLAFVLPVAACSAKCLSEAKSVDSILVDLTGASCTALTSLDNAWVDIACTLAQGAEVLAGDIIDAAPVTAVVTITDGGAPPPVTKQVVVLHVTKAKAASFLAAHPAAPVAPVVAAARPAAPVVTAAPVVSAAPVAPVVSAVPVTPAAPAVSATHPVAPAVKK